MHKHPQIIKGNHFADDRGTIIFNNDFNCLEIKRIYFIENKDIHFERGWQGHQIEQRWFSVVQGSFRIQVISIDNWETPTKILQKEEFILKSDNFDVLHIPQGFCTSIQALENNSRLMALSNYSLGEIKDEYRFTNENFTHH